MPVIDVHTHMFTARWLELLKKRGRPLQHQDAARRPAGDLPRRHAGRDSAARAISTTTCGSSTWTRPASTSRSSRSPVPNVYWGNEDVSCRAARESNDTMAQAQSKYPDRIRWFTSLPWEYPQRAVEELRAHLRQRRRRRHGAGQRCRTQPDRPAVRADLGGDRPPRAAGAGASDRPARRRHDGHDEVRPELVGRLHVRHDARDHPDDLRGLLRPAIRT